MISLAVYIYNVKTESEGLNRRNKFNPRAKKCRLIGYNKDSN